MQIERRSLFKKFLALGAGLNVFGFDNDTITPSAYTVQDPPLVAGSVRYGNMLFISGRHVNLQPAEIKSQTEHVLKTIEAALIREGSDRKSVV